MYSTRIRKGRPYFPGCRHELDLELDREVLDGAVVAVVVTTRARDLVEHNVVGLPGVGLPEGSSWEGQAMADRPEHPDGLDSTAAVAFAGHWAMTDAVLGAVTAVGQFAPAASSEKPVVAAAQNCLGAVEIARVFRTVEEHTIAETGRIR